MALGKDVTRTAFQIALEMLSLINRLERDIQFDLPRPELGCVQTLSGIVICEALSQDCGVTEVCEALADTGISRRVKIGARLWSLTQPQQVGHTEMLRLVLRTQSRSVKWSERRVAVPLDFAPEASASHLDYALKRMGMRVTLSTPVWKTGVCLSTPKPE